jgi:methylmalonyl-CoA mutase N-terminal domain/subunit
MQFGVNCQWIASASARQRDGAADGAAHVVGVRAFTPRREATDLDVPFGGLSVNATR